MIRTRLVFIDETVVTINMVRLRDRCPRGERLIGRVPQRSMDALCVTILFIAVLICCLKRNPPTARALYRDPEVLVIDEGTANLDARSEAAIVETVGGLRT